MTSFPVTRVGRGWVGAAHGGSGPAIKNKGGKRNERPPLCRVGRSMNLRKQVEPLGKAAL